MKIGDFIYTPRFCTVRISAIFATMAKALAAGFCEPTYYEGDYIVLGKSLDVYSMEFAAVPKEECHE